jgi:hypothetical protein
MKTDLFWLSEGEVPPRWTPGRVIVCGRDPASVADAIRTHREDLARLVLFWDAALGAPDPGAVVAATALPGDVWHAGLRLGMGGLPSVIDYVDPVWRFNRDPDPDGAGGKVATSWRLSLRACLARRSVVEQLGGPDPRFESLAAAGLELGHRWIQSGALMRHVPSLVGDRTDEPPALSLADEFRFLRCRYGRLWTGWSAWRAARIGRGLGASWAAARAAGRDPEPAGVPAYRRDPRPAGDVPDLRVSVLIPTLDRYPHLFALLDQLRDQTVPPHEIVVVDQTEEAQRRPAWPEAFADLPLRVIWRDQAGQCSSRNAGLLALTGDAVLFLDDDDEVEADLIERHLAFLAAVGADASCGVAEEVGAGALPHAFTYVRDSDVFPTNNSLLLREALAASGLFDLAYERGERADGDLGMRLYLGGCLLALNPGASVVHLHAPRGGLRQHNARVVTYSGSRASLRQRHLLAPTEGYLWQRYFTPRQVHEALLIRTVGTLRGGTGLRRLGRAALMTLMLPDTWRRNRERLAQGGALFKDHPTIPSLQPPSPERILWPNEPSSR